MRENEYLSHPLWGELAAVNENFKTLDNIADAEALRIIDQFRELLAITDAYRVAEWALVTESQLGQVSSSWAQINSHLSSYISSKQVSYLSQAASRADALREQLGGIPRPLAHGAAQANLTRSFNRYREELDASRERMLARLDQALSAASERESQLERRLEELSAMVETSRAMVATTEERISLSETRMDASQTANNEAFLASQSAREKDFKAWLASEESQFSSLADPHLQSLRDADSSAQDALAEIAKLRTSTVEMSSLAAGDILATEYGTYASSERRAAFVAYGIGAAAAAAGILLILFAYGEVKDIVSWPPVVLKFGLTAAAGGMAAVAFRFGGQAIRRATSFKRQELELRALQPFLMDVDGADAAKTAFMQRAFGHAWVESAVAPADAEVNESLVKLVTALAQHLPKGA